jgi:tetratricopeptide (TPR) repeat protein
LNLDEEEVHIRKRKKQGKQPGAPPSEEPTHTGDEQASPAIDRAELLQGAYTLLQEKRWSLAVEMFLAILDNDHEDEEAYLGIAAGLDALGRYEVLEQTALKILEHNPASARALAYRARALQKLERLSEATIANDQALLLDTNLGLAWINRSGLQLLQQKFPEALRSSQRAIELAPTDARAWTNRGMALLNFNRLAESLAAFEQSLSYDPTSLLALQMKGEILCKLGRMREVIPNARRALTLDPTNVVALTQAMTALRTLEQHDALQDIAQELIKIAPDNLFAWEHYIRGLRGMGRFEEANIALDRLLALEPDDVRFVTMKADTLYRLHNYREAATVAAHALRLDRHYFPARRLREKATKLLSKNSHQTAQRP